MPRWCSAAAFDSDPHVIPVTVHPSKGGTRDNRDRHSRRQGKDTGAERRQNPGSGSGQEGDPAAKDPASEAANTQNVTGCQAPAAECSRGPGRGRAGSGSGTSSGRSGSSSGGTGSSGRSGSSSGGTGSSGRSGRSAGGTGSSGRSGRSPGGTGGRGCSGRGTGGAGSEARRAGRLVAVRVESRPAAASDELRRGPPSSAPWRAHVIRKRLGQLLGGQLREGLADGVEPQ